MSWLESVGSGIVVASGIVAWVLTFIQIRDERRARARSHLADLALNSDFRNALGVLYKATGLIDELIHAWTKDGSKIGSEYVGELSDMNNELENKLGAGFWGCLFFLPKDLQTELNSFGVSLQQALHSCNEAILKGTPIETPMNFGEHLDILSQKLKHALGIEEPDK